MNQHSTPKYFFTRAWIYSKEMFPVLIYIPYIVALYGCLNFIVQILSGNPIVIDQMVLVGMISAFFMMLLMRTFDDLKDIEIDKELFPERATPRMAVLKSDIGAISMFSFLVLLNTNIFFGQSSLPVFALMITYCLLTYKWFFAERFHREHIFFTMLDHQPIPYVINFFLIHTALASGAVYEDFNSTHLMLWLIVSLPVTAWEVSRKIRSADMETNYETFSMVVGVRTATAIPLIALTATGVLCLFLGQLLDFNMWFYALDLVIIATVLFIYTRFLIQPVKKYNILTNTALVTTTAIFINLLVHTIISYGLE